MAQFSPLASRYTPYDNDSDNPFVYDSDTGYCTPTHSKPPKYSLSPFKPSQKRTVLLEEDSFHAELVSNSKRMKSQLYDDDEEADLPSPSSPNFFRPLLHISNVQNAVPSHISSKRVPNKAGIPLPNPPKRRGRPPKPKVPVREQEVINIPAISLALYVQYCWVERVKVRNRKTETRVEERKSELYGPGQISEDDPEDFVSLCTLLCKITETEIADLRRESFTFQISKNGKAAGAPFPLKNDAALSQLQARIQIMNKAERASSCVIVSMAKPKEKTGPEVCISCFIAENSAHV